MRPALGDLMSVNDDEPIRILKRGQPVGDSQGSPPGRKPLKRLLDQIFTLRIQAGGGLIQYQKLGIIQYGPGDGDSLPFTAGQIISLFSHIGIIAVGRLADKIVCIRHFCSPDDFLISGIRLGKTHVIQNRIGKKKGFLEHHAQLAVEILNPVIIDIDAVNQKLSVIHII